MVLGVALIHCLGGRTQTHTEGGHEASGRTGPAGPWVSDLQPPEPGDADPAGELCFRSPGRRMQHQDSFHLQHLFLTGHC